MLLFTLYSGDVFFCLTIFSDLFFVVVNHKSRDDRQRITNAFTPYLIEVMSKDVAIG